MNYNSRLTTITHTLTGHELQFEINSNHSRDMNNNSKLTAITHTLTGHELQFEINSNHSHTHGT